MNGLKWTAALCCESGLIRQKNEDNFYFNGRFKTLHQMDQPSMGENEFTDEGVFAVFDGMGGESHGELASFLAASLLFEYAKTGLAHDRRQVEQYIRDANIRICRETEKRHVLVGTTLVMAAISKDVLQVYNLGDSRAYLFRENSLVCFSKDHTINVTTSGMYSDRRSHRLSQYLGIPEDEFTIEPYYAEGKLLAGDKLLLCSDGLTDMLCEDTIKNILRQGTCPKTIARELLDAAIMKGGRDNITILVLICRV